MSKAKGNNIISFAFFYWNYMILAHIAGPSGSGKTTLANKINRTFTNIRAKDLDELDDLAVHNLGWGNINKNKYTLKMLEVLNNTKQKLLDAFLAKTQLPVVLVGFHTELPFRLKLNTKNKFYLDTSPTTSAIRAYKRSQHESPAERRLLSDLPYDIKQAAKDIEDLKTEGYRPISAFAFMEILHKRGNRGNNQKQIRIL